MSRESDIIDYVNSKQQPVSLADLTNNVPGNYSEAQIYASANQACTKQKIARGPEANTYCRIDCPGARLSKSGNNVSIPEVPVKPIRFDHDTSEVKPKKQRKVVTNDRIDLPSILEDLNKAGLKEVPQHKTDSASHFFIDGDHHEASYIIEAARKQLKLNTNPTKFARRLVGLTTVIMVYP